METTILEEIFYYISTHSYNKIYVSIYSIAYVAINIYIYMSKYDVGLSEDVVRS